MIHSKTDDDFISQIASSEFKEFAIANGFDTTQDGKGFFIKQETQNLYENYKRGKH